MVIQQLKYFMLVMDLGSFSAAAKKAYTTQPNISKNINELESELGYNLFKREKNGVIPTQKAYLLVKKVKNIIGQIDEIFSDTSFSENTQEITIAFAPNMPIHKVAPTIFVPPSPCSPLHNVKFDIHCMSPMEILNNISNCKVDLAFLYSTYTTQDSAICSFPLTRSKPFLYYSDLHPLAKSEKVSVESFKDSTFVTIKGSSGSPGIYLPYTPQKYNYVQSLEEMYLCIESGKYVGILGASQLLLYLSSIHALELETDLLVGTNLLWNKNNLSLTTKLILETLGVNSKI